MGAFILNKCLSQKCKSILMIQHLLKCIVKITQTKLLSLSYLVEILKPDSAGFSKDIFPEVHVLAARYDFISSVIYFFPLKYFSIKKTL